MSLPDELWQQICLLNQNKLLSSGLNKHFYQIIHQLDYEIFKEIDLNKTPKYINQLKICNIYLEINRGDLFNSYVSTVKHVRSLTTDDNIMGKDICNLTQITKLDLTRFNGSDYFDNFTNLTYLNCGYTDINFSNFVNLKTLIYNKKILMPIIGVGEFDKLTNLTELDLLNVGISRFDCEKLVNLAKLAINGYFDGLTKLPKLKDLSIKSRQNQDFSYLKKTLNLNKLTLIKF